METTLLIMIMVFCVGCLYWAIRAFFRISGDSNYRRIPPAPTLYEEPEKPSNECKAVLDENTRLSAIWDKYALTTGKERSHQLPHVDMGYEYIKTIAMEHNLLLKIKLDKHGINYE